MLRILYYATWLLCLCLSAITICVGQAKPCHRFKFCEFNVELSYVLNIFTFGVVFLLISANREGPDIIVYNRLYNEDHAFNLREPVYCILKNLFYNIGFSFFIFRAVLTFFSGLLVFKVFARLNLNSMAFFACYMPIFLFMDSMQFRNSVALYMLVYALYLLINDRIKYRRLIYIVIVILAAQIHTVFYFYLIFVLFDTKYENVLMYMLAVFSFVLVIITALNGNRFPFINTIMSIVLSKGDPRLTQYMTTGRLGFLLPTSIHLISMIILVIVYKSMRVQDGIKSKWQRIAVVVCLCSSVFIPLMMMNLHYYRILRNSFVISLIASVIALQEENRLWNRIWLFSFMVITVFIWRSFEVFFNNADLFDCVLSGQWFWVNN